LDQTGINALQFLQPKMPPLSFRLRSLSLRRPTSMGSLQSSCQIAVPAPESFRGGCSFGISIT